MREKEREKRKYTSCLRESEREEQRYSSERKCDWQSFKREGKKAQRPIHTMAEAEAEAKEKAHSYGCRQGCSQ